MGGAELPEQTSAVAWVEAVKVTDALLTTYEPERITSPLIRDTDDSAAYIEKKKNAAKFPKCKFCGRVLHGCTEVKLV